MNRLYSSIYSTRNIIMHNKDALYETSLRKPLSEQHTKSYLLVIDGSQDFSSQVQAEIMYFSS